MKRNKINLCVFDEGYCDICLADVGICCDNTSANTSGDTIANICFSGLCSDVQWSGTCTETPQHVIDEFTRTICYEYSALTEHYELFELPCGCILECECSSVTVHQEFECATEQIISECFSGLTANTFCVEPVQCDLFDTTICVSGCSAELKGGWFGGNYKYEGACYQTLPNNFENGWTIQFELEPNYIIESTPQVINKRCYNENELNPSGDTSDSLDSFCVDNASAITINNLYPNNKGIFYYKGLREENPLCNMQSALTCESNCMGLPYNPNFEEIKFEPQITGNSFMYFDTLACACESIAQNTFTLEQKDCCESIDKNNLAFMIKQDGSIGYRRIELSASCSGDTIESDYVLVEKFSNPNAVKNIKQTISVSFTPNIIASLKPCDAMSGETKGTLRFFVNNFQVFSTPFTDYDTSSIEDLDWSHQVSIAHYIGIGGGTIGNLCKDKTEQNELIYKKYCINLGKKHVITGISIEGIEIPFTKNISSSNMTELKSELKDILSGCTSVTIQNKCYCKCQVTEVCFDMIPFDIDYLITTKQNLPIPIVKKIIVPPSKQCGLLDEYFAGSFEGKIHTFKMFDTAYEYEHLQYLKPKVFSKCD